MHYPERVHCLQIALMSLALPSATLGWPIGSLHQPSTPVRRLPPAERAVITRLLRPGLGPLYQGQPTQTLDKAIQSFPSEPLRLGSIPALAVQASGQELCSPTGNCTIWIVDLRHRRILLRGGAVQTFAIDRSSTGALPDIITGMHGSATESDVTRWHFDGSRYERSECATTEYADADGNHLPHPRITPHPCNEGNDSSR